MSSNSVKASIFFFMREVTLKFSIDIFNIMLRTIQSFYRDGAHSFLVHVFVPKKISAISSKFSFL